MKIKYNWWLNFILIVSIFCAFENTTDSISSPSNWKNKKVDTIYLEDEISYIHYNQDTLKYLFNLLSLPATYHDTFLVIKNVCVGDTCFGAAKANRSEANLYRNKLKKRGLKQNISYTFKIQLLHNRKPLNIVTIINATDNFVLLEQGNTERINQGMLKVFINPIYGSSSTISLNFLIDEETLESHIVSKERIKAEKLTKTDKIGYCIDTTYQIKNHQIDWQELVNDDDIYSKCNF